MGKYPADNMNIDLWKVRVGNAVFFNAGFYIFYGFFTEKY